MNILCKMFQGDYVLQEGKIGHEFINFIKSDDGYFYIWLNSTGTYKRQEQNDINILMIRTIGNGIYAVLGKAINCSLVNGADVNKFKKPEDRFLAQKDNISYGGKKLSDIYSNERNVLATFKTTKVYRPKREIFVTNNSNIEADDKTIFKLNIKMKSSMRQYVNSKDKKDFNDLLHMKDLWSSKVSKGTIKSFINKYSKISKNKENTMYSILGKEKDENSISNSIYYFLKKRNCIASFLSNLDKTISKNQQFKIYREKEKIDLLFIGEKDIVVIENKINSQINGLNGKSSFKNQVENIIKS